MRQLSVIRETVVWNTKGKCTLHLDSLYNYWFCYQNEKNELSTSLFRRMQIQNKENKHV